MFQIFQDVESTNDSIITLDAVNKKLHNKRKQSFILICSSIFCLCNKSLIDGIVNFLFHDSAIGDRLSLGIYLALATLVLYFILSLVQETSKLMSQRDEINNLMI